VLAPPTPAAITSISVNLAYFTADAITEPGRAPGLMPLNRDILFFFRFQAENEKTWQVIRGLDRDRSVKLYSMAEI
jgi:hypothetical protein